MRLVFENISGVIAWCGTCCFATLAGFLLGYRSAKSLSKLEREYLKSLEALNADYKRAYSMLEKRAAREELLPGRELIQ